MINLLIHTYFLFLIDTHVSRKHLFVIFVILCKERRCIQSIRTFALAFIAVQAVFDLFHFRLNLRCELRRSKSDIRAQLLISMPAGHGMQ